MQDMSESVHIMSRVARTIIMLTEGGDIRAEQKKIEDARAAYDKSVAALEATPASEAGKAMDLAMQNRDAEALEALMKEAAPATVK